jgi:hypothetical protein
MDYLKLMPELKIGKMFLDVLVYWQELYVYWGKKFWEDLMMPPFIQVFQYGGEACEK